MFSMLLTLSLILSIIFLFSNHPLSMSLTLLLQTLCMCLISGSMSLSFWFAYVLSLIYLGGMLILFMYVTSLASNEMFSYSNKILLTTLILLFISLTIYYMDFPYPLNLYEGMENNSTLTFMSNNFLLKLYNQSTNIITILIASYLFLTLIMVVKIINIYKGPLRQMF
nr:NADH dehydrogenase subunit 6 [Deroplatys lobata]